MGSQLEEVGDEKETTGAGGGKSAFEQGAYVMFDVMTGNHKFARFAGAIEDFGLLPGQQARRERFQRQRFFLERP